MSLAHCCYLSGWAALIVALSSSVWAAEVASLTPGEAAALVAEGKAVLIDVREAAEWKKTGVVSTAHLLAWSDLRGSRKQWTPFLAANRDKKLILYCESGGRAAQVADLLAAEGYHVANAGGIKDWTAAGQPTRAADIPPAPP